MIAVVTGATRGIGQGIANALSEAGHYVIGTATSATGAEAIGKMLGAKGEGAVLDVGNRDSLDAFLDYLKSLDEAPLILVNNAGFNQDNLSLRMKPEEWLQVINGNLSGPFYLIQGLLRGMVKARFGRIINLSSVVARMGNVGQANYAAAKGGIEALTRSLAIELAARNITVNAVAPGFIETDMTRALSKEQRAAMLERIPANRLGSVEDVATLVGFLCSEHSGFITGETIQVNGGMYLN
jgi:3-oxoacyl-[acyl-carrier protein] reductase